MSRLSAEKRQQLQKLAAKPDREIDLSDIPEIRQIPPDAVIGRFYRPKKATVTIRLDADVLAWVKSTARAIRLASITATLRETKWKIGGPRGAAAQLGLPRTTLLYRMQPLGISSATPRRRFAQILVDLSASLGNDQAGDLQPLGVLAG